MPPAHSLQGVHPSRYQGLRFNPKAHPHSAEAASKMARAFPSGREMRTHRLGVLAGTAVLDSINPDVFTKPAARDPAGNPLRSTVGRSVKVRPGCLDTFLQKHET